MTDEAKTVLGMFIGSFLAAVALYFGPEIYDLISRMIGG